MLKKIGLYCSRENVQIMPETASSILNPTKTPQLN